MNHFGFKISIFTVLLCMCSGFVYVYVTSRAQRSIDPQSSSALSKQVVTRTIPSSPLVQEIPIRKTLPSSYHVFQTFNNCGPASLSMALRMYDITVSQEELGQSLRPYQVRSGDNDDKSVTLAELAQKATAYGLISYHRPLGNIEMIKRSIAKGYPVIIRTLTKQSEDIGHFRVIKGYDDMRQLIIQDDSLQGKNLEYSYADLTTLWKPFNFEYVVLIPKDASTDAQEILGEHQNEQRAWNDAVHTLETELTQSPSDVYSRFNLSVALYKTQQYSRSVEEFEKVEKRLPQKTLWYQLEPILAYEQLGNAPKVFQLSDHIFANHNKAYSELYLIRGRLQKRNGNLDEAKKEFEKAVFYNSSLLDAQKELGAL